VRPATGGQREKWHGDLRLVRSAERDGETGSYTWTVRQRTDQQRPGDVQDLQYLQHLDETAGRARLLKILKMLKMNAPLLIRSAGGK